MLTLTEFVTKYPISSRARRALASGVTVDSKIISKHKFLACFRDTKVDLVGIIDDHECDDEELIEEVHTLLSTMSPLQLCHTTGKIACEWMMDNLEYDDFLTVVNNSFDGEFIAFEYDFIVQYVEKHANEDNIDDMVTTFLEEIESGESIVIEILRSTDNDMIIKSILGNCDTLKYLSYFTNTSDKIPRMLDALNTDNKVDTVTELLDGISEVHLRCDEAVKLIRILCQWCGVTVADMLEKVDPIKEYFEEDI